MAGVKLPWPEARCLRETSMEIGVYHEFHCRPEQSASAAFEEALGQIGAADRWGLDAIWLAEIHQQPRRSVLTAPLTVAAAIAARTRRIKIGTGVQVLPLCHPLRLAEETATIDQISRGRLLFGVGRSGNPDLMSLMACPIRRAASDFSKRWKSSNRRGHSRPSRTRASTTASTMPPLCRDLISDRFRRSASPPPAKRRSRLSAKPDIRSLLQCVAARYRHWPRISPPTGTPTVRPAIRVRARFICGSPCTSPTPTGSAR